MGVLQARIDNRLLHGIIASQWAPGIGAMRVMVIDDEVASDELKKGSMKMAKPAGCALSIITMDTALANFAAGKYDGQTIFLIVREPEAISRLQAAGVKIPKLNVGATAVKNNEIKLGKQASVTKEEAVVYRKIMEQGTKVVSQYIMADPEVDVKDII